MRTKLPAGHHSEGFNVRNIKEMSMAQVKGLTKGE